MPVALGQQMSFLTTQTGINLLPPPWRNGDFSMQTWAFPHDRDGSLMVSNYARAIPREGAIMHDDARECLGRAAECARLAEDEKHPELKRYLTTLAASWRKAASETVEAPLQDA